MPARHPDADLLHHIYPTAYDVHPAFDCRVSRFSDWSATAMTKMDLLRSYWTSKRNRACVFETNLGSATVGTRHAAVVNSTNRGPLLISRFEYK